MKKREQKKIIKLLLPIIVIVLIAIEGYFGNDIYEIIDSKQVEATRIAINKYISVRRYT